MTSEAREPSGDEEPLAGLKVIDATQILVGPFCSMQLGDLGADVIKIERPGSGDQSRGWYPPSFGDGTEGVSAYYASVNRNKRSITLDLKSDEGQEIFLELISDADVLVENFRVGTLDKMGLGYADLAEENPDLIYCSLSGYGEWGPYSDRPAYDLIMQAEGGFMSITGEEGGEPVRIGVAIADIGAGMYATQAILAALLSREINGTRGQKIDVSLFDGQVAWLSYMASYYFATGESPGRMGSKHPTIVPYQAVETRDSYVIIAAPSEKLWQQLCEALDLEEVGSDERFETNADRVANRAELEALLEDVCAEYTTDALIESLEAHGVPARAIKDIGEVVEHPQVDARDMIRTVVHPDVGPIEVLDNPIQFSVTPTSIRSHPPRLGEHNDEVIQELGYDKDDIEYLRGEGVI